MTSKKKDTKQKERKKENNIKKKTRHISEAVSINWDEEKQCFKDKNNKYIGMLKTFGTNLFGLKEEDQMVYMNAFSFIFNSNIGEGQIYTYEVPANVDGYVNDYNYFKSQLNVMDDIDNIRYDILDKASQRLEDTAVTRELVDRCFIIILKDSDYYKLEKRLNDVISQIGMYQKTRLLNAKEMIEIIYDYYNPASGKFISTSYEDNYDLMDTIYPDYIGFYDQGFHQAIALNGLYCKTKWLSSFYKEPMQAMLCFLATYPNVEFSLHWIPAPQDSIKSDLDKSIQNLNKQINSEKDASKIREKQKEIEQNLDMVDKLISEGSFALYFSVSLRITAESPQLLNQICDELDKYAKTLNIKLRDGLHQPLEMFNLSAPICQNDVENYMLETTADTMGYMYPFVFEALYDSTSVVDNKTGKVLYNYPPVYIGNTINTNGVVFYDDFVRADDRSSSNEFIVGTTGMGKTMFLMWLIMQRHGLGYKQFIIDVEGKELNKLTYALKGQIIECANGDAGRINLLEIRFNIPENMENDDKVPLDKIKPLAEHIRFLRNFFDIYKGEDGNKIITILHDNEIEIALEKLYKVKMNIDFNTTAQEIIDNYTSSDYPIMNDLYNELVNERDRTIEIDRKRKNILNECIAFIRPLALGADSPIFNGVTTINTDASLLCFDISGLQDNTGSKILKAQYFNIISFIWTKIIANTTGERQKLIIDEFGVIMDKRYPDIMRYFENIIKRIRKRHAGLTTATQQVSDMMKDSVREYGEAIISQSTYQFFFGLGSSGAEYFRDSKIIPKSELEFIQFAGIGDCYAKIGSQTALRIHVALPEDEVKKLERIKG